jgi:serine/threonine-protein kinase ATR
MEQVLVKQFLSSTDTKGQGFLAWCAQQLLDYCQQSNQINVPGGRKTQMVVTTPAQTRWDALTPAAREALSPFLNSKYSLSGDVIRVPFEWPYYHPEIVYRDWIVTLTTELLANPLNRNAKQIFNACIRICKGQDISIAKFLFPVAVVHHVVAGTEKDRQNIIKEFLAVLSRDVDQSESLQTKGTLQQCAEVCLRRLNWRILELMLP